jgi:hypothetical protein
MLDISGAVHETKKHDAILGEAVEQDMAKSTHTE